MPKQREETKAQFIVNFVARLHDVKFHTVVGYVGPQNKLVTNVGSSRKYGEFKGASAAASRFMNGSHLGPLAGSVRGHVACHRKTKYYYEVVSVESINNTRVSVRLDGEVRTLKRKLAGVQGKLNKAEDTLFRFPLVNGGFIFVRDEGSIFGVYTEKPDSDARQILKSVERSEAFEKAMRLVKASSVADEILDIGDLLEAEDA